MHALVRIFPYIILTKKQSLLNALFCIPIQLLPPYMDTPFTMTKINISKIDWEG